jgi:hypothetical protein
MRTGRNGAVALTFTAILLGLSTAQAQADTTSYLDALSRHGWAVTSQSAPALNRSGLAMCNEMINGGRRPADLADSYYYPNASRQNLLDMATTAQAELCPKLYP